MYRRHGYLTLAAILLAPWLSAAEPRLTPDPWTAYFSTQGQAAAWATTVRGKSHGTLELVDTADSSASQKKSRPDANSEDTTHDLIVPLGWGIRSGKDAKLVSRVIEDFKTNGGESLKKELAQQVMQLQRNYTAGQLYWQVGNEINSRNLARTLGKEGGIAGLVAFDDPAMIPLYAEYVFAPTVEVLQDVSFKLYGDKRRIKVVLGTIANAHRESSRAWLEQLMEYRIKGSYAPGLANTRVGDNISIIGVHYVVTADAQEWRGIFDEFDRKWRASGKVEGIWGTEELGKKLAQSGAGAATAVRVAASYLSRAAQLQLPATALRCSFFGWRVGKNGTSADAGMQLWLSHFGNARLSDVSSQLGIDATGNFEGHAFENLAESRHRRLSVVFNRGFGQSELRSISLPRIGNGAAVDVSATLLSPDGPRTVVFTTATINGETRYTAANPVRLGRNDALVLREGA